MSLLNRLTSADLSRKMAPGQPNLVRPAIVALVILASAGLALVFKQEYLQALLVLILGAGLALFFLRWPMIGPIALLGTSFFVTFTGPSGLNSTMILLTLLLGLWLFEIVVQHRAIRLLSSRTFPPLLGLVVVAILSFGVGQLPWFSFVQQAPLGAQLAGLSVFVLSAGAFLLMAHQIKTMVWLRRFTWVFLALGSVFILGRAFPFFGELTKPFFQSMGPIFWIWMVGMAFSQAAFNRDLDGPVRAFLGFIVLVALYVLVIGKFADKSGWIPVLLCLGVILSARSPKFIFLLGLLGFVSIFATNILGDTVTSEEYSISTRLDAILILSEIIKANPILGLGFANYYWYTPLFPIRGFAVQFNSHNNYVDIVAQTGLLGLFFFLWFFWEVGRLNWRLLGRIPDGFGRAFVLASIGSLVSMLFTALLADWVLPFFYNVGLKGYPTVVIGWLFLGGLVVIAKLNGLLGPEAST